MSVIDGIPTLFLDRIRQIVPEDRWERTVRSFAEPLRVGFRVNTRSEPLSSDALRDVGAKPLPWYADGFVAPPESRESLLRWMEEGRIWIQNPSSMLPPVVLSPRPDGLILDLAAAPGSKTLQLASMVDDPGSIAAVEIVKDRFYRLKRNLKAQNAAEVNTYHQDGTRVWRYRPDHFDFVLLDAPCSTEGRFRADDPESYRYWSLAKIRSMARKQRQLLLSAVRCARVGGVVVYATCSFAPEENEAIVSDVLRQFPHSLEVEPIEDGPPGMMDGMRSWDGETFEPAVSRARRLIPDGTYEAFFVCRLRKIGETPPPEGFRSKALGKSRKRAR